VATPRWTPCGKRFRRARLKCLRSQGFSSVDEVEKAAKAGPLAFRFMLQPAMSAALAIRDGVRDARQGTPPFLWSIVFDSGNRTAHIREGSRATRTIVLPAVILDVIYQITVLEEFYPGEALIVGVTLGSLCAYSWTSGPFRSLIDAGWQRLIDACRQIGVRIACR
jgi:hypothetical protein